MADDAPTLSMLPLLLILIALTPAVALAEECACPQSYRAGLVGYWPFDEGAGATETEDISGAARQGRIFGAAAVEGVGGNALRFDGQDDYVDVGSFDLVGEELTISLWIKADSGFANEDSRLISKAFGDSEQSHYFMLSTEATWLRARLRTNAATTTLHATDAEIVVGQWTHVLFVYDGAEMRLYQDGRLVGSVAKTGTINVASAAPVWIGQNPTGFAPFPGTIDDLRIYDHALAADETCVSSCLTPRCGDGLVQPLVEQCDGGEGCSPMCTPQVPRRCGDRIVDPRSEQCDDGNVSNYDGCLNDCRRARCGDGFAWRGVEACDDGDLDDRDECTNECQEGDPVQGSIRERERGGGCCVGRRVELSFGLGALCLTAAALLTRRRRSPRM